VSAKGKLALNSALRILNYSRDLMLFNKFITKKMYFTVRSRLLIIRVARTVKAEAALSARGLARIPLPLLLKNCH